MNALDFLWEYFLELYDQYKNALTTLGWSETEKSYETLQYLMLHLNGTAP